MRWRINVILIALLIFLGACSRKPRIKGHLFIIGGGNRPPYMMEKIIELAGGPQAKLMIIPNASGSPREVAEYQRDQFKEYGAQQVDYMLFDRDNADADSNLAKLSGVTGIFFSGGDQRRLARDLNGTQLLQEIRRIYRKGGVISGTSAGAAVMGELMITGDELINPEEREFNIIKKDNIKATPGFGFIEWGIIDQHFIQRKRNNRLVSLVLENPILLGVGIDEATAILVNPDQTFQVIGESLVIVYDATEAGQIGTDKNGHLGGSDLEMHILRNEQSYDIAKREVLNES